MAWLTGWLYRKELVQDHTILSDDVTDFPALLSLATDSDLAARADTYAADLRITTSDGETLCPYQILDWDSSTGKLLLRFKAPTLSASADSAFYLYYGNAAATDAQSSDVWDSNYTLVLPFDGEDAVEVDLGDDFNDNSLDATKWLANSSVYGVASSSYVTEQNQRLEMGLISAATRDHALCQQIRAYLLSGNFDVQVDFAILTGTDADQWQVYLQAGDARYFRSGATILLPAEELRAFIEYDSSQLGRQYGGEIRHEGLPVLLDGSGSYVATADTSGKLRITRSGTTANTYYWDGDSWELLETGTIGDEDLYLSLWISAHEGQTIEAAFDNLVINSGTAIRWPGPFQGAGSEGVALAVYGDSPTLAAGQVGNAATFDGTDDHLIARDASKIRAQRPMTVEYWIKRSAVDENDFVLFKRGGSNTGWWVGVDSDNLPFLTFSGVAKRVGTTTIADTNWHHVMVSVATAGAVAFFVDGSAAGTTTLAAPAETTNNMYFARNVDTAGAPTATHYDFSLDEFRFSDALRSADYNVAMYANENSPATFWDVGAEEGLAAAYQPRHGAVMLSGAAMV